MNKNSNLVTLCMFAGMLIGMAAGCAIGISGGNIGIPMCSGLVIGFLIGAGAGLVIRKFSDKE